VLSGEAWKSIPSILEGGGKNIWTCSGDSKENNLLVAFVVVSGHDRLAHKGSNGGILEISSLPEEKLTLSFGYGMAYREILFSVDLS
jgi:hypothetical protein